MNTTFNLSAMLTLALGASLVPTGAAAQTPPETPGASHRPTVLLPVKHDRTIPLRDMPQLPIEVEQNETPHPPLPVRGGPAAGPHQADPSLQTAAPTASAITPLISFGGIGNLSGVLPPDTNGDVGPSHYVQWVNLNFAVYDKTTGNVLYGPASGKSIWQGFGSPCETSNDGDPIVLYDEVADRWLMSQFALPNYPSGPYYQCIAVSTTGSPLGSWNRYVYSFNKMNDYPKFGVWSDGYYMSMNQFTCTAVGCRWAGQGVVAYDRAAMLNGTSSRAVYFDMASDASLGGMLPADLDGSTSPPAGAPDYFMQFDDQPDQLQLWEFHADWANTANATFTKRATLATASFDSNMCNGSRNCIPQAGTTAKLDAIADRLMYRLQYRNFGTYDTLVVNHTVDAGSDRAAVRWYEVRNPHSSPAIRQQGTFAPADTLGRWMGSAAMDKDGNIAIGYSVSNGTTYPAIRFTGRLAGDPLGTLTVAESDLRQGTGSQTHSSGRWGDYSMLAVDPSDGCTFWYTTEYYNAGASSAGWSTNIGSFKIGTCGSGGATAPAAPSNLAATAASSSQINLAWTDNSSNETQFNVERCQGSGCTNFAQIATVGANVTTYADQSLAASTTYEYRVIAANGSLVSSPSNVAQATTQAAQTGTVIHVASMTGSSSGVRGNSGWRATVKFDIRDGNNVAVSNATVSGTWSAGYSGTASCVTDSTGTCSVTTAKLSSNTASVTFTLNNVTHPTATYDGQANGTSVVIAK